MRPIWLCLPLAVLLAAAPATRPAHRFTLRVRQYQGAAVAVSAEVSVEPGVPFDTRTTVGRTTLAVNGTFDAGVLDVRYAEATADGACQVSTRLMPALGREQDLAGSDGWRVTATLVDRS